MSVNSRHSFGVKVFGNENKKKKYETTILNLSEDTFKFQKYLPHKNNLLPNINNRKLDFSFKKNKIKEEKSETLNSLKSKIINKSSNNLVNGIIWNVDNKIIIPRLMVTKKKNSNNNVSPERKFDLSKIKNKMEKNELNIIQKLWN